MQLFPVCFFDRGKARSRRRIQSWIRDRIDATIQDLDQEADRLADRLEEYMKDKKKRDFEIRLLKDELEKRKTYPRGVPPGPSQEELREQREKEAEKKRKDAKLQLKFQPKFERQPFQMIYFFLASVFHILATKRVFWPGPPLFLASFDVLFSD